MTEEAQRTSLRCSVGPERPQGSNLRESQSTRLGRTFHCVPSATMSTSRSPRTDPLHLKHPASHSPPQKTPPQGQQARTAALQACPTDMSYNSRSMLARGAEGEVSKGQGKAPMRSIGTVTKSHILTWLEAPSFARTVCGSPAAAPGR